MISLFQDAKDNGEEISVPDEETTNCPELWDLIIQRRNRRIDAGLVKGTKVPRPDMEVVKAVTVWALPKSTLVRVGIAHVRSSIYVAHPTSDSQFSAVLLLSSHRYKSTGREGEEVEEVD
jgi:hypothetical protein